MMAQSLRSKEDFGKQVCSNPYIQGPLILWEYAFSNSASSLQAILAEPTWAAQGLLKPCREIKAEGQRQLDSQFRCLLGTIELKPLLSLLGVKPLTEKHYKTRVFQQVEV